MIMSRSSVPQRTRDSREERLVSHLRTSNEKTLWRAFPLNSGLISTRRIRELNDVFFTERPSLAQRNRIVGDVSIGCGVRRCANFPRTRLLFVCPLGSSERRVKQDLLQGSHVQDGFSHRRNAPGAAVSLPIHDRSRFIYSSVPE